MLEDFIKKYFLNPIIYKEGYNFVNTLFYSIIFVLFALFSYNLLKKLKIKINLGLILSIIPFILSAIIIRVLRDANITKGIIFVTPFIWFFSFILIISTILLSYLIQKKTGVPYYKIMFLIGFLMFSVFLPFIKINNVKALLYVFSFTFLLIIILILLKESIENKLVLGLQTFDSIVTAVSIEWFGYIEQHVLPRLIIEKTGTAFSFIFIKFILTYICLKLLDNQEDKEFSNFLKLLIAILGLATGGRDLLRLLWGI